MWCKVGQWWAKRRQGVESLYPAFAEVLGNLGRSSALYMADFPPLHTICFLGTNRVTGAGEVMEEATPSLSPAKKEWTAVQRKKAAMPAQEKPAPAENLAMELRRFARAPLTRVEYTKCRDI